MRAPLRLVSLLACLLLSGGAVAQDFFRANYAGATGKPAQLNVCGDSDVATYRVDRRAGVPQTSDIRIAIHLFAGIRAVSLDEARSSPGVSVVSFADPTTPVLSLPDIGPGNASVEFALVLEATCDILDTIIADNDVVVRDSLSFAFSAVGQPRTEQHLVAPYRASVSFPVLTLEASLDRSVTRVGELSTRTIEIANGSFRGYADTLLYELEQGPGAIVTEMAVNGTVVPFGKTVTTAGDTLVSLLLAGDAFRQNRNGNNVGNGDTRYDPNERILITETIRVLDCRDSRMAKHTVRFGCEDRYCAVATLLSDLPLGSGQPALRFSKPAGSPDVPAGYCQLGELSLWVRNLGRETDPSFGQARDISVSALASFDDLVAANNYRIVRVDVAGQTLPGVSPVVDLDDVALFASDPDGVGEGLEDYDGDGVFDDLALLDSFPIKIYYEFDCATSAVDDPAENCANDAATTFQSFVYFEDACGRQIQGSEPSVYSPRNVQDAFEQRTQSDAFAAGDAFQVELEFGRLVFDFANSCRADGEIRAYAVLPQGVTIDTDASQLSRGSTVGLPILGVSMSNDTAMIRFDPSAEPALNGKYTLRLGLVADCTTPLRQAVFPTTVAYHCPDCDCEHVWICEDVIGPWIHKTDPPCPAATLFPCPSGVQGTRFQIDRTTVGFADPDFTTRIDLADVNTKVALPADSVLIQIDGVVGDAAFDDDLGVILHYLAPTAEADTAGLFLLNGGTLEWDDGTATRTCQLGRIPHTLESDDVEASETWQRFDLSDCVRDNGWRVNPGDAIRFRGRFEVNPRGPIKDEYEFVGDLRGGFTATDDDGDEALCDQFGDIFRVGRPAAIFGTPSNDQYPKGCDPSQIEFKLTSINRGYAREFGLEYRRAARLDSVVITFDTSIFAGFGDLTGELLVAGHPTEGSTYFEVPPLTDFRDGRYVLQLDTLDFSADLVTTNAQLYSLRFTLAPDCGSIRSGANGDFIYPMTSAPYFRDRYYARDIGDGARVLPTEDPRDFAVTYEDPAVLRMDQITPAYQRIVGDSASVEIEVCNTSSVSSAGRSWLTFDDTTSLEVEEVLLVDDIDDPTALAIAPYPHGHFVSVEGLARVNGVNATAQVCNLLRIKVRVKGCEAGSLAFASGWACDSAVPPGWTPDDDAACVDDRLLSTFEPIAPFLEADLVNQPTTALTLCTQVQLDFQVNNAEAGTSYEMVSRFYVPEGLTYVPGTAEVAYPAGTGFRSTVDDIVAMGATVRGNVLGFADFGGIHPYLAANGLPGFDPADPSDSSRLVIRLTFETDCDFRSGSLVFFEAEGAESCGGRTNLAATESTALLIDGTEPDGTHLYSVTLGGDSRLSVVDDVSTLTVSVVNAGTDASDADDVLSVTLPQNLRYEPGSAVGGGPDGYDPGEPRLRLRGGVQTVEFQLPLGMAPGGEARLDFDVRAAPSLSCGDAPEIMIAAYRYITAGCVDPDRSCDIPTDITVSGARVDRLPVGGTFGIDLTHTSSCEGLDTERVDLRVVLRADGFSLDGTPVDVGLYFDTDSSGDIGAGDELLLREQIANRSGDTTVTFRYEAVVQRDRFSALYLLIDSSGTGRCGSQTVAIPAPRLVNASEVDSYTVCLADANTLDLGTAGCDGADGVDFAWTSLPAGFEAFLDDASVAAPTLAIVRPYSGPDTLRFVLASTRDGLNPTTDTVMVIVSPGVELDADTERTIDPGRQVVLQPGVLVGELPLTYQWAPPAGLSGDTDPQPVAMPSASTIYTLVVTDASGCSSSNTHTVNVDAAIVAGSNFTDTTICPGGTVDIRISGGPDVSWRADESNPVEGGLSAPDGPNVTFDPRAGLGVYRFTATVRDPGAPSRSDEVTVTIAVEGSASCRTPCLRPRLVSEVVIDTDCDAPSGSISLAYDSNIGDYSTHWINAAGDTLGEGVLELHDLSPGVYTMLGVNRLDTACVFEERVYVSAADAPRAILTGTLPAECDQANGSATVSVVGGSILWSDGSMASVRDDLTAGVYYVSSFDPARPSCRRYLRVEIGQTGGLVVAATVTAAPTCGQADGEVTLTVDGGSGDYAYSWASDAPTQSGLPAGPNRVTVTDRVTGCEGVVDFVLASSGPGVDLSEVGVRPAACLDFADGGVGYALDVDPAVALPLDSAWTRGGSAAVNGSFSDGTYCLTLLDADGCVVGGDCFALDAPLPIAIDLSLTRACGLDGGSVTVRQNQGASPLSYMVDARAPSTEETFTGLKAGNHGLVAVDPNGCVAVAAFSTPQCGECDLFPEDELELAITCGDSARLCLPGVTSAQGIVVYVDNRLYTQPLVSCVDGAPGVAVTLPVGEHRVVVVDEVLECSETVIARVNCTPEIGSKFVFSDTIFINQTSSYCPDPSLGPWTLNRFPDVLVEGGVDSVGRCVVYRGLTLGTDTIDIEAIVGRDTTSICLLLTVAPYGGGVKALADTACTARNQPIRVNVLADDEVYGGIASFAIVSRPDAFDGTLEVNADNTVTFTPEADVCARDAAFVYEVCNGNTDAVGGGCAQAEVTICIRCDGLAIFTAVTPNGDGKNDVFWVDGITEFPNNHLQIFNRWGTIVYETRGYQNEWAGTYLGDPLPGGAYYYILDVEDGGEERSYNGYVEVIR